MKLHSIVGLAGAALTLGTISALAQSSPPSYQADPSVYKVIFEDANFRVIEAVRKAGVKDKPHGHPLPSAIYNVTDCSSKLYTPDGKVVERREKADTASAVPIVASHQAENVGTTDCKQIFVEKK